MELLVLQKYVNELLLKKTSKIYCYKKRFLGAQTSIQGTGKARLMVVTNKRLMKNLKI